MALHLEAEFFVLAGEQLEEVGDELCDGAVVNVGGGRDGRLYLAGGVAEAGWLGGVRRGAGAGCAVTCEVAWVELWVLEEEKKKLRLVVETRLL